MTTIFAGTVYEATEQEVIEACYASTACLGCGMPLIEQHNAGRAAVARSLGLLLLFSSLRFGVFNVSVRRSVVLQGNRTLASALYVATLLYKRMQFIPLEWRPAMVKLQFA